MLSGMITTDNPYGDGNAIIERTHEVQREMFLAFVRAAAGMARETANDPVESAMDLAEQVLREQPPPGAERRKWLDAVLTRVCGNYPLGAVEGQTSYTEEKPPEETSG